MILHALSRPGRQAHLPHLVWLHGFLGNHQEWEPVSAAFQEWPQLLIDLPGHGASSDIMVADFAAVDAVLSATLRHYQIYDYWLVGYSLGGRVAMYHATHNLATGLQGIVVEGGHPGLSCETERAARKQHDAGWAKRFRHEPLVPVLHDWYQQAIFSDLDKQQRAALVALRSHNHPAALASMLEATSLCRQPDLQPELKKLTRPFYYLCGERDDKFRTLAAHLGLTPELIFAAGHNAHRDDPVAFSARLLTLLRYSDFKD